MPTEVSKKKDFDYEILVLPFIPESGPVNTALEDDPEQRYIFVFSDIRKLRVAMARPQMIELMQASYGTLDYVVKQANNPVEFFTSIWKQGLQVMIDVQFLDDGNLHWTEPREVGGVTRLEAVCGQTIGNLPGRG